MYKKKIAIVVAMDAELKLVLDSIDILNKTQEQTFKFYTGTPKNNKDIFVILSKCGIGKVNSAICASKIIERYSPDVFISSGVCGCLNIEGVPQGSIFVNMGTVYHDAYCGDVVGQIQDMPFKYKPAEFVEKFINVLREKKYPAYGCQMISGDWFVDDRETAQKIHDSFCTEEQICGIDMESGSLSQTCFIYSVPFVGIRIVSDCPLTDSWPSYSEFWAQAPDTLHNVLEELFEFIDKN